MPGPKPDPVVNTPELPAHADVVIIGGGIAGVATALELADRGLKVALCEKGHIAGEQSSRNWGWVRLTHRDRRELPLMVEAQRLWQAMDARIGADTGYVRCGVTYTTATAQAFEAERSALEDLQPYQIPARLLNREEALAQFPGLSLDITGALHNPYDGRAEPQKAVPAMARAVQARGGSVHQDCAVRVVETAAGRVSGVVTEKGRIACSAVLVAGGVWSRLFLGNLGIALPQLRTKGNVLRTDPVPDGPEGTLKFRDFTMRRRADGGYTIASALPSRYQLTPDSFRLLKAFLPTLRNEWRNVSLGLGPAFFEALRTPRRWSATEVSPFERARVLDPVPDETQIDRALEVIREAYEPFRTATVAQKWAGYIDVLPDIIPVISGTEGVRGGIPGLYVSTGFSGHGFGLGTGAGRLAADLITGAAPIVDPAPFRLHRFSDGSGIRPTEGVIQR
ncbi:FAD-binding oxidoreductase [Pseudooceanicola sp. CBS1P-1]|uniref:FAD-dependent oxidoreductase n=1 Tax=Pseudooceanicola albus TaxID=2692189 RepID=A0A6L7G7A3_9RHOB|nr:MULTISPECIES: FAD-binding oxidoreductase [Pseudooceanicola]MBT9384301.1 FAD-binding oxidoreductase [Pseudooceanicola endophyticus]MXN19961.1 FAD-dependent oxidoreductase [Pseudooceanicola albus]